MLESARVSGQISTVRLDGLERGRRALGPPRHAYLRGGAQAALSALAKSQRSCALAAVVTTSGAMRRLGFRRTSTFVARVPRVQSSSAGGGKLGLRDGFGCARPADATRAPESRNPS